MSKESKEKLISKTNTISWNIIDNMFKKSNFASEGKNKSFRRLKTIQNRYNRRKTYKKSTNFLFFQ